jgi:hypothetical protein
LSRYTKNRRKPKELAKIARATVAQAFPILARDRRGKKAKKSKNKLRNKCARAFGVALNASKKKKQNRRGAAACVSVAARVRRKSDRDRAQTARVSAPG